jgi:hypothetical protein
MQTFKFENINKVEKLLSAVTCNCCGKHLELSDLDPDYLFPSAMHSFEFEGGYGSEFDYERITFDLCDDCLIKIFDKFEVPVETETLF